MVAVKCSNCQTDNREGARFCEQCAAPLSRKCPNCGADVGPKARFCDQCGHDLAEPKAAPPLDYTKPKSYTPRFLAEKILSTGKALEGERKLVTVLFADVAGYTSMSEKLDPEEVHQIMEGCFQILMDEIHRYEGTIDKFTGDGIMALFGAPLAHEDHAQRACYAALAVQKALEPYADRVKKESKVDFKMRVGLNSGPVIVGAVGGDLRMDYTAVGDTVNLASRMQTLAQPGTIMVSKGTHKLARDFFRFKSLGKKAVKGKEESVEAYELLEPTEVATRIEAAVIRGLTKFVGRDKEMATLKEAFEKARSGSGQVVGVVGEAGVGKSRLLFELKQMLPEGQHTFLEGRCLHYGGPMPYLPFLDILRVFFNIEEGDREFIIKKKLAEKVNDLDEKLKEVLPPLEDILSLKVEDEAYLKLDAPLKRTKIFEAIRDVLVRESQNKPLVLAVEDLHWIDKTSEEFLGYLIGFLANAGILLILLYRPEYTHQWGSKSYYRQIGVDQLPLSSSAELVRSILDQGEASPDLRELILNRAAGNPLFMEEFTRTLLENGSIGKRDHQYVLIRKASEIQVPDTIQGIIAARMDRLDENMKRTMQVASVIGRDFAFRILQSITGMREELKSYLINLQGLEFIYEKSLFPELEYIFKHALTQEVAYNTLLLKRRKEIHRMIGKAVEELYSSRLEEFYEVLGHHYLMGDDYDKAYQYLKSSAEKATRTYSCWEAFRFYKEAIRALKALPPSGENKRKGVEIRLAMRTVILSLGFPEDSLGILHEGEDLCKEICDERSLAELYSTIGFCYSVKESDPVKGQEYMERRFEQAERLQDTEMMTTSAFLLCTSYGTTGDFSKGVQISAKVIALLERTQRQSESFGLGFNIYSGLLAQHGASTALLGDFVEGQASCDKALDFAVKVGDSLARSYVELCYGYALTHRGNGQEAIGHLQNAAKAAEEAQMLSSLPMIWAGMSWGHYLSGDFEASRTYAERSIEAQYTVGVGFYSMIPYWVLGMVLLDSGDLANAQQFCEEALNLARKNREKDAEANALCLMGRIVGARDKSRHQAAEGYILQGIDIDAGLGIRPTCAKGYFHLGVLYADAGYREKALQNLGKAEAMFGEMGMDYWLAKAEKALGALQA